jgi:hypothetical protein
MKDFIREVMLDADKTWYDTRLHLIEDKYRQIVKEACIGFPTVWFFSALSKSPHTTVTTARFTFDADEWLQRFHQAIDSCVLDIVRWIKEYALANPDEQILIEGPNLNITRHAYQFEVYAWMHVASLSNVDASGKKVDPSQIIDVVGAEFVGNLRRVSVSA